MAQVAETGHGLDLSCQMSRVAEVAGGAVRASVHTIEGLQALDFTIRCCLSSFIA